MNLDEYYPQFPYATQLYTGAPTQHGFRGLGNNFPIPTGQATQTKEYYCSSFPWSGMHFEGLGEVVPHIIGDKGLEEQIASLVRGAAVNAVKENQLGTLHPVNLENVIYQKTCEGLAGDEIEPLSEQEFERKLHAALRESNLGSFFSKLTAPLRKVASAVKRAVKPVTSKIAKVVRKVAPVVVAAAATYFTAGAALPYLKKYSATIGQYWGSWNSSVGKVLGQAPPPQPEQPPQGFTDPSITDAAVPMAQYQLSQQGINMNSPQAQATLAAYIRGQQANMAQATGNPNIATGIGRAPAPAHPVAKAAAIGIPLAAAALFLL